MEEAPEDSMFYGDASRSGHFVSHSGKKPRLVWTSELHQR